MFKSNHYILIGGEEAEIAAPKARFTMPIWLTRLRQKRDASKGRTGQTNLPALIPADSNSPEKMKKNDQVEETEGFESYYYAQTWYFALL